MSKDKPTNLYQQVKGGKQPTCRPLLANVQGKKLKTKSTTSMTMTSTIHSRKASFLANCSQLHASVCGHLL